MTGLCENLDRELILGDDCTAHDTIGLVVLEPYIRLRKILKITLKICAEQLTAVHTNCRRLFR